MCALDLLGINEKWYFQTLMECAAILRGNIKMQKYCKIISLTLVLLFAFTGCVSPVTTSQLPVESQSTITESSDEASFSSSMPENTTGTSFGALHVTGTNLMNEKNEIVQLKGLSSHGISWFPQFVNYDAMKQMKEEWNCTVFRLAMYTDDYNGYSISDATQKEALKALIDQAVTDAKLLEMYLIIDWHILSDHNPNTHIEDAKLFFEEMSEKYADEDHVIYEICNEPNGNTTWKDIKQYANIIIPIIRRHDTDAVILVGTPTWSQDVDIAAKDPLSDYDNIMYSLHFYADTHRDDLRSRMVNAFDTGLPIFVSEFGIVDASGNGNTNEEEADKWLELMNKYSIGFIMWNFSNKDEGSAMIKSTVEKTGNFTLEDLSPAGLWFIGAMEVDDNVSQLEQKDETSASLDASSTDIVQIIKTNSWGTAADTNYQYELTLDNQTNEDHSNWTIEVTFSQDIVLQECWNGICKVDNKTIMITPEQYNQELKSGEKISNIGITVKSNEDLQVVTAVCS